MHKLTLRYPEDRPTPQLLTEDGIDLTKLLPITRMDITVEPFEYPKVVLTLSYFTIDIEESYLKKLVYEEIPTPCD